MLIHWTLPNHLLNLHPLCQFFFRSRQTSLAIAVTNFTKPVTKINSGLSTIIAILSFSPWQSRNVIFKIPSCGRLKVCSHCWYSPNSERFFSTSNLMRHGNLATEQMDRVIWWRDIPCPHSLARRSGELRIINRILRPRCRHPGKKS